MDKKIMNVKEAIEKGYMIIGSDFHGTNLTVLKYEQKIIGMKNGKRKLFEKKWYQAGEVFGRKNDDNS